VTTFAFRALDRDGDIRTGRVDEESEASARSRLSGRGLLPVELVRETPGVSRRRGRVRTNDLALGLQALATLLEAGLPLDHALGALEALAPPSWRPYIPALRGSVREGATLAAALDDQPFEFSPAALGIVHAGEAGSGLSVGVRRAADLLESQAKLRAAIRSALAYPLLLAVAGLGAVILLVGVVLPRFAVILQDLGQELPRTTQWVLSGAEVGRIAGLPALGMLIAGGVLHNVWTRTPRGRRLWHGALLRTPFVRGLRQARATAQACAALGALLRTGCPLPVALRHAATAADDAEIAARLEEARSLVGRGDRLAVALSETNAMSPTAIRLLSAGEQSGRLADMVERAGELEAAGSERRIKQYVQLIEPAMILTFGGLVALVAAALLQAVYAVRPLP